ncbi:MAG TPA: hypothetical protein VMH28_22215 [Candidatus Acidoferrales bacterium]|nr:hypothetical protein [Candidatus Acidoferrales bacterium]
MQKALARLRAKTDRELSILAEKQIEQTITLAERGRYGEAARAYGFARRLVAVADLPASERARLEKQLALVRESIELPAPAVA